VLTVGSAAFRRDTVSVKTAPCGWFGS
jgi:hypothetical protein